LYHPESNPFFFSSMPEWMNLAGSKKAFKCIRQTEQYGTLLESKAMGDIGGEGESAKG